MRKASTTCLVLLLALCLPGLLGAQTSPQDKAHEGFFMRFLLGGGPGKVTIEGTQDLVFKAIGMDFHFQIGKSIGQNFIVFGDLGGFSLSNPDAEYGGQSVSVNDASVSAMGFGGGFTYYMMPANVYFSGSILYCKDTIESSGSKGESEYGLGFFIALGKEWWIGNNWGLGAALFLDTSSLKDQADAYGNQAGIKNFIYGIAFSATMD